MPNKIVTFSLAKEFLGLFRSSLPKPVEPVPEPARKQEVIVSAPFYQDNLVTVFNGSCRSMFQLPNESVQCVVTSPPYWGLRKYAGEQELVWGGKEDCQHVWVLKDNPVNFGGQPNVGASRQAPAYEGGWGKAGFCSLCGAWQGGFGLEPTPELYVQHTVEILREIRRVLRKDGVVWWNIGDSYFGGGNNRGSNSPISDKQASNYGAVGQLSEHQKNIGKHPTLKPKDLCLIPFRVAIAAQEDGWFIRSVIIWNKTNPMPESVKDRPTESHEYILMLTKSARYYYDQEAVREPIQPSTVSHYQYDSGLNGKNVAAEVEGINRPKYRGYKTKRNEDNEQHHGQDIYSHPSGRNLRSIWTFSTQPFKGAHFATYPEALPERCIRASSKEGDIVLDPFAGSGTTLQVARSLGRRGVGYEISTEYCQLIVQRVNAKTREEKNKE